MYRFDKATYLKAHSEIFTAYSNKYKNRTTPLFEDGIVFPDKYQGIVFFMKEAYSNDNNDLNPSLIDNLQKYEPWGMWNHVAEWAYGLTKTTENSILAFNPNLPKPKKRDAINSIAVINIKKVNGKPVSDDSEIMAYAEDNAPSLLKEIETAQPRIIVCGGTMKYLDKILGITRRKRCDNWYYWLDIGNLRDILVLDYCHPAFRSYSLLYYYGITNIYQQALLSKGNHRDNS